MLSILVSQTFFFSPFGKKFLTVNVRRKDSYHRRETKTDSFADDGAQEDFFCLQKKSFILPSLINNLTANKTTAALIMMMTTTTTTTPTEVMMIVWCT